jgi:hypothetical protein
MLECKVEKFLHDKDSSILPQLAADLVILGRLKKLLGHARFPG